MDSNVESKHLKAIDPEIAQAVAQELDRQETHLELIASENTTSLAVMAAQGSVMTNKYAEGYPEKRYYGGCEYVDIAEKLAVERACMLFDAEYANVQPHSGSQANMAVYFAILRPGDKVLGMSLAHGGHLTHGSPASFSGRLFDFHHYGVNRDTGRINYDDVARLAREVRPRMIVCGASAYPRIIDFKAFGTIARDVGARLMVDMAHIAGLVAAEQHPSPIPHADVVTSTTHKTLRGPRGGLILARHELAEQLNKQIFPGIQGGPLMHVIAAKAVALKQALGDDFKRYQQAVVCNAGKMAEALLNSGIRLVTGGTDNHMLLVDLRNLGLTGKDAETALGQAGITANKNSIPFDERGPAITSGLRLGTPVVTTRGMGVQEMVEIAGFIEKVLRNPSDRMVLESVRQNVVALCRRFPLYPEMTAT